LQLFNDFGKGPSLTALKGHAYGHFIVGHSEFLPAGCWQLENFWVLKNRLFNAA
jgi:hypothetical protein